MQAIKLFLLTVSIFFGLNTSLRADSLPTLPQSETDSMKAIADGYLKARKADQAIAIYHQVSRKAIISSNTDEFLLMRVKVGYALLIQLNYEEALRIADSVYVVAGTSEKPLCQYEATLLKAKMAGNQRKWGEVFRLLDEASTLNSAIESKGLIELRRAEALIQSNNLESAEISLDASKNIYDSLGSDYELSKVYFQKGLAKTIRLESDKAMEYLEQARDYYEKDNQKDGFLLVEIDTKMGVAYHQLGLFSNAIEVFNKAIKNAKAINPQSRELVVALNSLARTYLAKPNLSESDLENALNTVNEALDITLQIDGKNGHYTALCHQTKGRVYLFYGDYDKAIENYDKAAQIVETYFADVDSRLLSMIIYSKGVTQVFNQQREEGLKEMGRSLEIALTVEEGFEKQIIDRANYLAVEFLLDYDNAETEKALKYYHLAVTVNSKSFTGQKYHQNPEVDDVLDTYQFYRSLIGKAYSYMIQYDQTEEVQSLENAYTSLNLASDVADKLRASPMSYEDQLNMSIEIAESLHYGVNVGYDLYELTGERKYAEFAFKFFEKSKANQALYNLNVSSSSLGIPQGLLDEEKEIRSELTSLETLLFHEEKRGQSADLEKMNQYRAQVNRLNDKLIKFKNKIRNDFPSYYALKFSNQYAQIEDIQNAILDDNEALISYSVFLPDVYSIKIDKQGFDFKFHRHDTSLTKYVEAFNRLVQTPTMNQGNLKQYVALSDSLTSLLIHDPEELSKYSKVTVIPDGILHSLPFELLLTDHIKKTNSFNQLPYRIKSQAIHYATSATALMQLNESAVLKGNKVLAYAPLFDESSVSNPNVPFDSIRSAAGNLAHTQSEVTGISKYFEVVEILDRKATEKNFRENASDYPIIHVASHGIIEPTKTIYSKLLFSPYDTDSLSDGYLNMREILTLDIPAKMVVLSACNTGSGEILFGEGVLSMANGFFYAGAKSVITTLWTANDQSTARVMDKFYENLAKEQTKSEALRNAKLEYLNQADGLLAHPYYWAHFTVNGDDSPIVQSSLKWYYWLVIIIIGLMLIRTFGIRKRSAA